jgi:RNA-binding protein
MPLTSTQRAHLRGLAHKLDAVVLVGAAGVTEAVIAKVSTELENHELIKVKVNEAPETADEVGALLADGTRSELVQRIGHIVVLYRRRKRDPEIRLPAARRD